jgi:hypothetical protein
VTPNEEKLIQLINFYDVQSVEELALVMLRHIESLQAKLAVSTQDSTVFIYRPSRIG